MHARWVLGFAVGLLCVGAESVAGSFSFKPYMEAEGTLMVRRTADIDGKTATVTGSDAARPKSFTFEWGDGTRSEGLFPASHAYEDISRNYDVTVTAKHGETTETARVRVEFLPGPPMDWSYKRDAVIQIPDKDVTLGTTMPGYEIPEGVSHLTDEDLHGIPRDTLEYILEIAHRIEMDFCNYNVTPAASDRQVVLKTTMFPGAMALWYTDPPSFACHPSFFQGDVGFAGLFHEMGHNITLNSPASFRFGGKTDGPMNTIVSETLATIFSHATIYQILNAKGHYGLSDDICRMIRDDSIGSIILVRDCYRRYIADTSKYATYNDPETDEDETFNTFLTVVYVFIDEAEKKADYRGPLKRMMRLLHTFCEEDRVAFQDKDNEAFRATFMVAGLSYGFETDLRPRFRALGFPVSDDVYARLMHRVAN
jgi:hypothetical protein